jgi:hypothetical protein
LLLCWSALLRSLCGCLLRWLLLRLGLLRSNLLSWLELLHGLLLLGTLDLLLILLPDHSEFDFLFHWGLPLSLGFVWTFLILVPEHFEANLRCESISTVPFMR